MISALSLSDEPIAAHTASVLPPLWDRRSRRGWSTRRVLAGEAGRVHAEGRALVTVVRGLVVLACLDEEAALLHVVEDAAHVAAIAGAAAAAAVDEQAARG